MEQWQIEVLQKLLETKVSEVEVGSCVYEKWGSRVQLQSDEIPAILKALLTWHLEEVHQSLQQGAGVRNVDDEGSRSPVFIYTILRHMQTGSQSAFVNV